MCIVTRNMTHDILSLEVNDKMNKAQNKGTNGYKYQIPGTGTA